MNATGTVGVMRGIADQITDADDVFLGMLGFDQAELRSGKINWRALTPPEFLHLDEAGMRQASLGGFTVPYQKEFVHKDGSRIPVLLVCALVPGIVDGWIGYVVNLSRVTHQPPVPETADAAAAAAADVPQSNDLYEPFVGELVRERQRMIAMLNNTDGLIWAVDTDCCLLFANSAFQRSQRRFSGVDLEVGESVLSPRFTDDVVELWRGWYQRAFNGERFTAQTQNDFAGTVLYSEHLFSPIVDEIQRVVGATVMSQDVSPRMHTQEALRSSEARFRTIAAQSPLGIFLTDAAGACVYANPRTTTSWGVPEAELLGYGFMKNIHQEDRDRVTAVFNAALEQGSSIETEYNLRRADGTDRHLRVWATPIREGDTISGFAGSIEDDTEQRELAARLGQREKMESLGTLAGGIAHDFNNMLGIVLGHAELALTEQRDLQAVHENLREIRTASVRARDLVQQILAFSRQVERAQVPVDLRQLATESVKLLRSAFPVSVTLDVRLTSQPVMVLGDASALQQIIVNLCTNAEHAMRSKGGGVLTVTLDAEGKAPTGRVLLTVRDTGEGMTPEVSARAFEPFFTTKPVGEGTGMGLAVVHGVVSSYGGTMSVDSTVGVGTTVRVALPLTSVEQAAATQAPDAPKSAGIGRVLLAEDEPALARFAERALVREGYDVTTCHDGLFALERFQQSPGAFDVVLTDLTMPGLSGDRLALAIKGISSEVPVILMTGFSQTLTSRNAKEHGIDVLLDKPFSARDLVAAVAKAIRG